MKKLLIIILFLIIAGCNPDGSGPSPPEPPVVKSWSDMTWHKRQKFWMEQYKMDANVPKPFGEKEYLEYMK